jgi:hypothetical protein
MAPQALGKTKLMAWWRNGHQRPKIIVKRVTPGAAWRGKIWRRHGVKSRLKKRPERVEDGAGIGETERGCRNAIRRRRCIEKAGMASGRKVALRRVA